MLRRSLALEELGHFQTTRWPEVLWIGAICPSNRTGRTSILDLGVYVVSVHSFSPNESAPIQSVREDAPLRHIGLGR